MQKSSRLRKREYFFSNLQEEYWQGGWKVVEVDLDKEFIYLARNCLLNSYKVPSNVLAAGNKMMTKTSLVSSLMGFYNKIIIKIMNSWYEHEV